jgi:hypothetical protein
VLSGAKAPNFFDQFDDIPVERGPWEDFQTHGPWEDFQRQPAAKSSGNFFDQFDVTPQAATFADRFAAAPQPQPTTGEMAWDAVKQLGSGIAEGIANIPTTVPILMRLAGKGVSALANKYAPGLIDQQQEQRAQQRSLDIRTSRSQLRRHR